MIHQHNACITLIDLRVQHVAPVAGNPAVKHAKKKKHKSPVAKSASVAGCTLTAQVSLSYAIS